MTRAIHHSNAKIAEPETIAAAFKEHTGQDLDLAEHAAGELNQRLAALIQDVLAVNGWVAGYKALVKAAPKAGLHPRLVEDVANAESVYSCLSKGHRRRGPIDVAITIGHENFYDSIDRIGPKSGGGKAWKASQEYKACISKPEWKDPGYSTGFSPCVAWGWIATMIKVIPREHLAMATTIQLLSVVEYDLDLVEENKDGIQNGFQAAEKLACAPDSVLQGVALTGLISYDLQVFVRRIQQEWNAKNEGVFNLGPEEVSPSAWVSVIVADCATLSPFGYETAEVYNMSRTGMIAGSIGAACHDTLYDTGCSNRINLIQYAEAAGVARYGLHAAFFLGYYEAVAKFLLDNFLESGDGASLCLGHSVSTAGGLWSPFNTRYRSWERCVKYTRQLLRSSTPEAKALLELAHIDQVLKEVDFRLDAGLSWARALRSDDSDLRPRTTEKYFVGSRTMELLETPGVQRPVLCLGCGGAFEALMNDSRREEVHAIGGLPETVTVTPAAGLAVGIRQAVLWASSSECCDTCASRIGYWADAIAYTVLSALMHDEPYMGPSTWLLQCYFVGTITLWPISLPFLLSGFDLMANISCEKGAMGVRDVVDK